MLTNLESPAPLLEYAVFLELRTELHETETHANLPSHIDEVHVIEDLLAEHEAMLQLCETSSIIRPRVRSETA